MQVVLYNGHKITVVVVVIVVVVSPKRRAQMWLPVTQGWSNVRGTRLIRYKTMLYKT